jgi:hypothetical protein
MTMPKAPIASFTVPPKSEVLPLPVSLHQFRFHIVFSFVLDVGIVLDEKGPEPLKEEPRPAQYLDYS